MELLEFSQKFLAGLERNKVSIDLTLANNEKLYNLTRIMLEVNKQMNLTAITDEDSIIIKHYVD